MSQSTKTLVLAPVCFAPILHRVLVRAPLLCVVLRESEGVGDYGCAPSAGGTWHRFNPLCWSSVLLSTGTKRRAAGGSFRHQSTFEVSQGEFDGRTGVVLGLGDCMLSFRRQDRLQYALLRVKNRRESRCFPEACNERRVHRCKR